VQGLIDASDAGNASSVIVSNYTSTQLAFHVKGAVITPLCEDYSVSPGFCTQMLISQVRGQVLRGAGAALVDNLAAWLRDSKTGFWSAARLWELLALMSAADSAETKVEYTRKGIELLCYNTTATSTCHMHRGT
jgi:hypothetical protein